MNPVAEAVTRWPELQAMGRPLEDVFRIVNEQTGNPVENPVTRVLREGRVVGLANHTVLLTPDGSRLPIDDSGAPIRTEAGDLSGVVLVFRDVTERRRAEEAESRLTAIVHSSDDAIVSKNLNGIVRSWNPAAQRLFGYTSEEAIGRSITLIIPPERLAEEDQIHPGRVEQYLRDLRGTLRRAAGPARQLLHADLDRIVIHPIRSETAKPFARAEVITTGKGLLARVAFVVAGAGFEPATFGL